jgi:exopolysaccharide production protein ExoQ
VSTVDITLNEERALRHAQREFIPWISILFILACLFMVEHTLSASKDFAVMMGKENVEELTNTEVMFEQSPLRQIGGILMGLYGFFWIVQRRRTEHVPFGFLAGLIVFYFGWLLLSITWSIDPGVTFRRLVLFGLMAVAAYAVAIRFSLRDILYMALVISCALVLIGVIAEIRNGTFRPAVGWFRFCGTLHPNKQAVNCSIFFLSATILLRYEKHKFLFLVIALIAFGFLYLTKSRTALACTIAALLAWWGLVLTDPGKIAVASIGVAAVCTMILFAEVVVPAIQQQAALGRTDIEENQFYTLTGRTKLWSQLGDFAAEKPILGYGYGAFWTRDNTIEVMEEQGWPVAHAHNAYIDLQLAGGPVPTVLFALIFIIVMRLVWVYYRDTGNAGYAFLGVLLTYCILNGLLESILVHRGQLTFFAMVAVLYLAFRKAPVTPADQVHVEPEAARKTSA